VNLRYFENKTILNSSPEIFFKGLLLQPRRDYN